MCTYICFQNLLLKVGKGWTFHPNRIRNSGSGSSSPKIGCSTSKTAFKFIPLWRVLGEFLQVTEHTQETDHHLSWGSSVHSQRWGPCTPRLRKGRRSVPDKNKRRQTPSPPQSRLLFKPGSLRHCVLIAASPNCSRGEVSHQEDGARKVKELLTPSPSVLSRSRMPPWENRAATLSCRYRDTGTLPKGKWTQGRSPQLCPQEQLCLEERAEDPETKGILGYSGRLHENREREVWARVEWQKRQFIQRRGDSREEPSRIRHCCR